MSDFGGLQQPFDPKDLQQWQGYRQQAAQATAGINNMPYVYGGSNSGGYDALANMSPEDIFAKFYRGSHNGSNNNSGNSNNGVDPALQALLAALGFGGLGGLGSLLAATGTRGSDSQQSATSNSGNSSAGSSSGGGMRSDAELAAMGLR